MRAGRSVKRTLQLREDILGGSGLPRATWLSSPLELGEDNTDREDIVRSTSRGHRSTDDGTQQKDWQSKLGTLCRLAHERRARRT